MLRINKTMIAGRLTRDPEQITTKSGALFVKFSVAVSGAGQNSDATFYDCIAFEKQAKYVLDYIKKGNEVIVDGTHEQDWYNGNDGVRKHRWVLKAFSIQGIKAADATQTKPVDNTPQPNQALKQETTDKPQDPWMLDL